MANLWRSIRVTLVMAVILGLIYPLVIALIGNLAFPFQAAGSMVKFQGHIVGSELIAQQVTTARLFHPRPSAVNYAGNDSGGSNLGPTNPVLLTEIKNNERMLNVLPGTKPASIPTDMVESSASGLDPDISIQDAMLQIPRIAQATGLSQSVLLSLVHRYETGRFLGIWGEPMVNVMQANLAIKDLMQK